MGGGRTWTYAGRMATDYLPALARHPQGTVITVWAVPGASRSGIVGLHDGAVRIRVSAPAQRGRANAEVAKVLAAALGAPVELVSGAGARRKRFLVMALGIDEAAAALDAAPHL